MIYPKHALRAAGHGCQLGVLQAGCYWSAGCAVQSVGKHFFRICTIWLSYVLAHIMAGGGRVLYLPCHDVAGRMQHEHQAADVSSDLFCIWHTRRLLVPVTTDALGQAIQADLCGICMSPALWPNASPGSRALAIFGHESTYLSSQMSQ
jgi:hypothetical protein